MKFYTDKGRNASILNNLKIKKNGKTIKAINKNEINNEVKNKYKDLFSDKGTKNNYINSGIKKDLIVTKEEIENLFNRYIKFNDIPKEITTFRLLCLIKKDNGPGDINNIRPIAISSTILKLTEKIILKRLLNEIDNKNVLCN